MTTATPKPRAGEHDDKMLIFALREESDALREERDRLEWDVQAYRGALGYSVSGDHSGRLTDGTFPSCGLCASRSEGFELLKNELQEAQINNEANAQDATNARAQRDVLKAEMVSLMNMLTWHVNHEGECLGDHPELLEAARALLAKHGR
jgi:hypothetical protein